MEFNSETLENSPALDAVRLEMGKILSDPSHQHHAGFKTGEKAARDYVDGLYAKAVPAPVAAPSMNDRMSIGSAQPQEGETVEEAEARQRNDYILAPLKDEWGTDFERRYASAIGGMRTLFEGRGDVLDELGTIVRMEYGIEGERAALKFLSALDSIKNQGG